MLRKAGLDPDKDVTIVAVGTPESSVAALASGAVDAGVVQPPDQLALADQGFHVLYDLAAQQVPAAGAAIVLQRMWLNLNRDVAQRFVDALVQAIARSRQDKVQASVVLQKYLKNKDQRALGAMYDFFVGEVTPRYPVATPALFVDTVSQLSATDPTFKDYDVSRILDPAFVQSAMDRHVGGP
jgi:NitT/TauT family transport system substrate-binding protein